MAWNKPWQSIINKGRSGLMSLAGIENRESRLDNWESSLDSCKDGEFSVNLLLNSTVSVVTDYCSWLKDGCRWSVGRKVDCYKDAKCYVEKKFQQFLALSDVKLHHQLSIWLVLACKVIT